MRGRCEKERCFLKKKESPGKKGRKKGASSPKGEEGWASLVKGTIGGKGGEKKGGKFYIQKKREFSNGRNHGGVSLPTEGGGGNASLCRGR